MKITILGAGSWSSAIAHLLSDSHEICMLARRDEQVAEINLKHTNTGYLPDLMLNARVRATTSKAEALEGAQLVINGVPTQQTRRILEQIKPFFPADAVLLNLSKGIERGSGLLISRVVKTVLGDVTYAVLSGPSHAEEVALAQPTTVVIASADEQVAISLQALFMRPYFRVYTGDDVIGVELGGAVKNVLALGIGIGLGLGYGDNAKAALITRGVHEMVRFGAALGGQHRTLYGLAGLGDLIVTATSGHSRNRRAGYLIGQGRSLDAVKAEVGQVIEGASTCEAIYPMLGQLGVELPITEQIYRVLFEGSSGKQAIEALMHRERKSEFYD